MNQISAVEPNDLAPGSEDEYIPTTNTHRNLVLFEGNEEEVEKCLQNIESEIV